MITTITTNQRSDGLTRFKQLLISGSASVQSTPGAIKSQKWNSLSSKVPQISNNSLKIISGRRLASKKWYLLNFGLGHFRKKIKRNWPNLVWPLKENLKGQQRGKGGFLVGSSGIRTPETPVLTEKFRSHYSIVRRHNGFLKDGPFPASFSLFSHFLTYNW